MHAFFEARSVAVVGISPRPDNLARNIADNLLAFGYDGLVQYVGARGGVYRGQRIHRSLLDLPEPVELAVVLAPARHVPGIFEDCARLGIRRLVVESSGFDESGPEGRALAERLRALAREHGIRFVGPNGLGVLSLPRGLALPFARLRDVYPRGGISLLCQSGGVGLAYLNRLAAEGLGVARFASMGNKLDVDENDLLEWLLEDPATEQVVLYLESFSDGRRFLELLSRARKPVLVHKANTGRLAATAAASHTAAVAGDDAVVEAALERGRALRFRDGDELVDLLALFAGPEPRGPRVAVLSRSGGHAVVAADAIEEQGLELADLPPSLTEQARERGRAGVIRPGNPVDLGDVFDLEVGRELADAALALPGVDALLYLHTYLPEDGVEDSRQLLLGLAELESRHGKPVLPCVVTEPAELEQLRRLLGRPLWTEPARPLRALSRLLARRRAGPPAPPPAPLPAPDCSGFPARSPLLHEALELLRGWGLAVPRGGLARSPEQAAELARELGPRVVLKVVAGELSHKSDAGGVLLDVPAAAAAEAWRRLREVGRGRGFEGVLVQEQVPPGFDLLLGLRRDPAFGPVLVLGAGGRWVELLRDTAVELLPAEPGRLRRALLGLRAAPLYTGGRGERPLDLEAAIRAALALGRAAARCPRLLELDVNPLRLLPSGALALDARMRIETAG